METKKKLSVGEKFAYGIGAVGKDMVYMLSATYILYYGSKCGSNGNHSFYRPDI